MYMRGILTRCGVARETFVYFFKPKANSADPIEMPYCVSFHLCLHFSLLGKIIIAFLRSKMLLNRTYKYCCDNYTFTCIVYVDFQMFLFRSRIVMLSRYSANQSEYLVVKHRDGRIEHIHG